MNVLCLLRGCPSSSQRQLIPLGLPFYPEKHTPGTGQSASRWQPRIWLLSRRKEGECNVNDGACQELVGQEAFVQPVLALCSAVYKTRGKKLSWSHGIAIEAGLDSSAPVPAAAWVVAWQFGGTRSGGEGLLRGEGMGGEAVEDGNRGRWVWIRPWGLFPLFPASTCIPRAQIKKPGGSGAVVV